MIDLMYHLNLFLLQFNDSPYLRLSQRSDHKLIELNTTCLDAILKALSVVMNEIRRNKVFTVINTTKNARI